MCGPGSTADHASVRHHHLQLRFFSALLLLPALACECGDGEGLNTLRPIIRADPNPLTFGAVYPGVTAAKNLAIENTGTGNLEVTSVEIAPGSHPGLVVEDQAFLIPVSGAPVTFPVRLTVNELGPVTGKILVSSNDPNTPVLEVPIVATGEVKPGPGIAVCVSSADLGLAETCGNMPRVEIGSVPFGQSVRATISIRSIGTLPLGITSAEAEPTSHPSFVFDPASIRGDTLAPSEARTVEVTFTPSTELEATGLFKIISTDVDLSIVTVVLTGRSVAPAFCLDSASVDFGTVGIGEFADRTLALKSCGEVPVQVDALLIDGANSEFSVLNPLAAAVTLNPNDEIQVQLRYAPTDGGIDNGRLRIESSLPDGFVNLVGRAAACDLDLLPRSINFGGLASGRSLTRTVLISNIGAADCVVSNALINGNGSFTIASGPARPFTIAAGGAEEIDVQYSPSGAGAHQATLDITSNDPDELTASVQLDGRQLAAGECALSAVPDPLAFGAVTLGTVSTRSIQVTNTGGSPCALLNVSMAPSSAPDFRIADRPLLPFIGAGSTITIDVAFEPLLTQLRTGEVLIQTSITGTPFPVQVLGSGSGAQLCITPNPVVFGTTQIGIPVTRQVNISACGSVDSVISGLSFSAATSNEYQILNAPALPRTMTAGSQLVLDVRYTGTNLGRDDGHLVVASNDALSPTRNAQLVANTQPGPCGDVIGKICGLGGTGPVPGAVVSVQTPSGPVEATTNEQGDFVLTCVPPGTQTVTAQSGSWNTNFVVTVFDAQITTVPGQQCLNPNSAEVAVVWGQWDQIENILDALNIPYTFYDENQASSLFSNPATLAQYDIVFLNCGFPESLIYAGPGLTNLRDFVNNGGSLYSSDYAYDAIELTFPAFIDFGGDDNQRNAAETGTWSGALDVVEATLRSALGGRSQVPVDAVYTSVDAVDPAATVFLRGAANGNRANEPFMMKLQPMPPSSGQVMFTSFHNNGQADILAIFRWLISQL